MGKRVQSPSSIGTFKQCPRKYYYQYIKKLRSIPNIHQTRGKAAHEVLEDFFDTDLSVLDEQNFEQNFKLRVQTLLVEKWKAYQDELESLGLTKEQEILYFEETIVMLFNWLSQFIAKMQKTKLPFQDAFNKLRPVEREKNYQSSVHEVRGIIDAVEKIDEDIRLMDYKTSKKFSLDAHKLQLAIYALLYHETHGVLPSKVGVYFLKQGEKTMDVDQQLLDFAKLEVKFIHEQTLSDDIVDYPKKTSPLCRWSTGQCDFYATCKPFR